MSYSENLQFDYNTLAYNRPQLGEWTDDDSDDGDSDDNTIDEIIEFEEFGCPTSIDIRQSKEGMYVIGAFKFMRDPDYHFLYVNSVHPATFHQFSAMKIKNYFYFCSGYYVYRPYIEILRIYIIEDVSYCVIKTHWLRLVQRTWKSVIRRRNQIYKMRSNPHNRQIYELTGKYPHCCQYLPQFAGMLSQV
jgi:hypothetical protein